MNPTENMKCLLIVVVALIALTQATEDEAQKLSMQFMQECKASSGWHGDWKDDTVTHERKCFYECLLKKFTIMKPDGTLDKEKCLEMADQLSEVHSAENIAKVKEIAGKCIDKITPSSDSCETGYLITSCFIDHAKELSKED